MKSSSGPKARRRMPECTPSAPMTRPKVRGAARAKVTCTPSASWSRPVTVSPKMYSVLSRVAW